VVADAGTDGTRTPNHAGHGPTWVEGPECGWIAFAPARPPVASARARPRLSAAATRRDLRPDHMGLAPIVADLAVCLPFLRAQELTGFASDGAEGPNPDDSGGVGDAVSVVLIILALWLAVAVLIATLWALIGLGLGRGRCHCVVCSFRNQMPPPASLHGRPDAVPRSTASQADQRPQP
jgi:hypothetical protein